MQTGGKKHLLAPLERLEKLLIGSLHRVEPIVASGYHIEVGRVQWVMDDDVWMAFPTLLQHASVSTAPNRRHNSSAGNSVGSELARVAKEESAAGSNACSHIDIDCA